MNKKLTLKDFTDRLEDIAVTEHTFDEGRLKGLTINVKNALSLEEAMRFVGNIVGTCADLSRAEYVPEAFDFSVRLNTVEIYAGMTRGKTKIADLYKLMYCTDLYDSVRLYIDGRQYNELIDAAKNHIEFIKSMLSSVAARKMLDLASKLESFTEIADKAASIMSDESIKMFADRLGIGDTEPVSNKGRAIVDDNSEESNVITLKMKDTHADE